MIPGEAHAIFLDIAIYARKPIEVLPKLANEAF
jgi:hypothetical protein